MGGGGRWGGVCKCVDRGRKRGDKPACFWDLHASTAITIIPSPSGVYCVCVEEGRGV